MIIIPAIDILGGHCVRLHKGRYNESRTYRDNPSAVAGEFEQSGATWIHVVDLDAARGQGANRDAIRSIRRAVSCRVEVGGGVRTRQHIEELLDLGVDRLILGTVLAKKPDPVLEWIEQYGERLVAGVDAHDGEVRVSGWEQDSGLRDEDFAATLAEVGLLRLIYTSIAQDGTLAGPDIARTTRVAHAFGHPTILSGGIGSNEDIERVYKHDDPNIAGVITGKALYEGHIDLAAAIDRFQTDTESW